MASEALVCDWLVPLLLCCKPWWGECGGKLLISQWPVVGKQREREKESGTHRWRGLAKFKARKQQRLQIVSSEQNLIYVLEHVAYSFSFLGQ